MKNLCNFLKKNNPHIYIRPRSEHQSANNQARTDAESKIDADPARSMSIASFERLERNKEHVNLYNRQYVDRDPARKSLPQVFQSPYIEHDPARDFGPADKLTSKMEVAKLQVAHPQYKDDSQLPKNIVYHSLIAAGINVADYSEAFLTSAELLEAMKVRGFILNKNLDDQQVKRELRYLVDDLNNKYIMQKPLIPSLDMSNRAHLLAISNRLSDTLVRFGYSEKAGEIKQIIQQVISSDEMTAGDASQLLAECVDKILQNKPLCNEPILLYRALQSFKEHLDIQSIEEAQTKIKQELNKSLAHLAKPGAEKNSALNFSVGIPFAGIGTVDLAFEIKTGYSTANSLSIKSSDEKKLDFLVGVAVPIAGITGGLSCKREVSTITKSLEQLVDDEAGKIVSHILKMPMQGMMNVRRMKALQNSVQNYDKIRNNTEDLTQQLQMLGVLDSNVDIKAPQQDTRACSH